MTLLFVYGTLKRGGKNHHWMLGQTYRGEARTVPGYRMFGLDGYPGMVAWADDSEGVLGELWEVDVTGLARIDELEGLDEGLYRRVAIPVQTAGGPQTADTYLYARPIVGRPPLGPNWQETGK